MSTTRTTQTHIRWLEDLTSNEVGSVEEASKTVENIENDSIKELQAVAENKRITRYRGNDKVPFVVKNKGRPRCLGRSAEGRAGYEPPLSHRPHERKPAGAGTGGRPDRRNC